MLAGLSIPDAAGLAGHSDADVVTHALIDALLGAAALGTIGEHFPDDDPAWEGVSSIELLERTCALLKAASMEVVNVDAVIIAQTPRLQPHLGQMRANLARTLGVDARAVGLKAKSPESLGHLGRGEALVAQVVALLRRASAS